MSAKHRSRTCQRCQLSLLQVEDLKNSRSELKRLKMSWETFELMSSSVIGVDENKFGFRFHFSLLKWLKSRTSRIEDNNRCEANNATHDRLEVMRWERRGTCSNIYSVKNQLDKSLSKETVSKSIKWNSHVVHLKISWVVVIATWIDNPEWRWILKLMKNSSYFS